MHVSTAQASAKQLTRKCCSIMQECGPARKKMKFSNVEEYKIEVTRLHNRENFLLSEITKHIQNAEVLQSQNRQWNHMYVQATEEIQRLNARTPQQQRKQKHYFGDEETKMYRQRENLHYNNYLLQSELSQVKSELFSQLDQNDYAVRKLRKARNHLRNTLKQRNHEISRLIQQIAFLEDAMDSIDHSRQSQIDQTTQKIADLQRKINYITRKKDTEILLLRNQNADLEQKLLHMNEKNQELKSIIAMDSEEEDTSDYGSDD